MSLDHAYVYVFIRQDLPIPLQLVHSCHATYHATAKYRPDEGVPNLIVIGVPDMRSLRRVIVKLKSHQVPHYIWNDPDISDEPLSVASAPLDDIQRSALSNYRLYTQVAQLREHSTFSREVAVGETQLGGNPALGANSQ